MYASLIFTCIKVLRPVVAQGYTYKCVTVDATGCGFDRHSRK